MTDMHILMTMMCSGFAITFWILRHLNSRFDKLDEKFTLKFDDINTRLARMEGSISMMDGCQIKYDSKQKKAE
jgi:hypothetical protein